MEVLMKFIFPAMIALLVSGTALADLNSKKKEANDRIEKNRSALEVTKTCVTNATSEEAIRACRVEIFPEDPMAQRMEENKSNMDKMKGKMKEGKQKMEEKFE